MKKANVILFWVDLDTLNSTPDTESPEVRLKSELDKLVQFFKEKMEPAPPDSKKDKKEVVEEKGKTILPSVVIAINRVDTKNSKTNLEFLNVSSGPGKPLIFIRNIWIFISLGDATFFFVIVT